MGVVLVSVGFESSSPNRKPVVLLLSSRPISARYVRDRVTGIEYRLSLERERERALSVTGFASARENITVWCETEVTAGTLRFARIVWQKKVDLGKLKMEGEEQDGGGGKRAEEEELGIK